MRESLPYKFKGVFLSNIFTLKCCFNCEQRDVYHEGKSRVVKCGMTGKKINEVNETRTNHFPEWCPKKRMVVVNGGKR